MLPAEFYKIFQPLSKLDGTKLTCYILAEVDNVIDSRIESVLNFVAAGSRVADVGADHGYLAIELILSGRASKVIATEKNLHPFEALKKNIFDSGLNSIEVRLGDGLKILSAGEVDTICIGGWAVCSSKKF